MSQNSQLSDLPNDQHSAYYDTEPATVKIMPRPKKPPPLSADAAALIEYMTAALTSGPDQSMRDEMNERLMSLAPGELAEVVKRCLMGVPVQNWPKEIADIAWAQRNNFIAQAERGDARAREDARELLRGLVERYRAHDDPMVAYLAARSAGPHPKLSAEELRNAWARCRRKKPKANASDLANMLAFEGLGEFHPDALRRRLHRFID